MLLFTPEISWHSCDPIYSISTQLVDDKDAALYRNISGDGVKSEERSIYRCATASGDKLVRIWLFCPFGNCVKSSSDKVVFAAELSAHQASVNCVRFCPVKLKTARQNEHCSDVVATASDDCCIILWRRVRRDTNDVVSKDNIVPVPMQQKVDAQSAANIVSNLQSNVSNLEPIEGWKVWKMLRAHLDGVYDIAWSSDGTRLVSASVDNTAIVWSCSLNQGCGQKLGVLRDAKGYVQGVLFDPLNHFVCALSSDRALRVYDTKLYNCKYRLQKLTNDVLKQVTVGDAAKSSSNQSIMKLPTIFSEDMTIRSFFRRMDITPDGLLLFLPSIQLAKVEEQPSSSSSGIDSAMPPPPPTHMKYSTFVYMTGVWNKPLIQLPSFNNRPTFCVKVNPIRYNLIPGVENRLNIPYRHVFVVLSLNEVTFYDTQTMTPLAFVDKIHYDQLTDAAWCDDGRLLMLSSTDGYCSFVTFSENEFGTKYTGDPLAITRTYSVNTKTAKKAKTDGNEQATPKKTKVEKKLDRKSVVDQLIEGAKNASPDTWRCVQESDNPSSTIEQSPSTCRSPLPASSNSNSATPRAQKTLVIDKSQRKLDSFFTKSKTEVKLPTVIDLTLDEEEKKAAPMKRKLPVETVSTTPGEATAALKTTLVNTTVDSRQQLLSPGAAVPEVKRKRVVLELVSNTPDPD